MSSGSNQKPTLNDITKLFLTRIFPLTQTLNKYAFFHLCSIVHTGVLKTLQNELFVLQDIFLLHLPTWKYECEDKKALIVKAEHVLSVLLIHLFSFILHHFKFLTLNKTRAKWESECKMYEEKKCGRHAENKLEK